MALGDLENLRHNASFELVVASIQTSHLGLLRNTNILSHIGIWKYSIRTRTASTVQFKSHVDLMNGRLKCYLIETNPNELGS
jgi:hypothetical protein